jgi:DNA primase
VIPSGFIQDLLARVDIVEVIGRSVQLRRGGQNHLGLCPFHAEKSPSFTVSPTKQFFHCFGCGAHGSAIGFLMDHRGLGYVEAVRELAQQAGLPVPEDAGAAAAAQQARSLTDAMARACSFYQKALRESAAVEYLKGRGLTGRTALRFALGYSPDGWQPLRDAFDEYEDVRLIDSGLVITNEGKRYDRFRNRVMFPIRNRRGAVIGFGGRVLGAGEPKYLNSPETPLFHKGQELYGLYEALEAIRRRGRAIVCEGYMDVIQLSQAGFEESVATLGTAVSATHVTTLLRLTDHVIFAFDGDAAGLKAARRALEVVLPVLGDDKRASFVLLPGGDDPDDLIRRDGPVAFETELGRALPLSRFFERCVTEDRDLSQAEDRAAMMAAARPLLETMMAGAMRLQLMAQLAQAGRTSVSEVESLFGLQPWRRLGGGRREGQRQQSPVQIRDLRQRLQIGLLAFPELAREFNGAIAEEFIDRNEAADRQILEIWRAATSHATGHAGALLEALADSEHAEHYRLLAAQEMLIEGGLEEARNDCRAIFTQLELDRVTGRIDALSAVPGMSGEQKSELRELLQKQAALKRDRVATAVVPATVVSAR